MGNVGQGKYNFDLTNKSYKDIIFLKGKMSDVDVRKWYIAHDKNILDKIDKSQTLEQQARQAFAHMFEAQFDNVRYAEVQKYFPNSLAKFEGILKEAVKK